MLKRFDKYLLLLFIFSLFYSFYISRDWFSSDCTTTTLGDLETHYYIYSALGKQLFEYHWIYPVDFSITNVGAFIYRYSPFPYLFPYIFYPFFGQRLSFMLTYILSFSFVPITFYIFLKSIIKKERLAFIVSWLLFVSPTLNVQFSIFGSYHTIFALNFFFLGLAYLFRYSVKPLKRNLNMFMLFSFLTFISHIFTAIFYFFILIVYSIVSKKYKILIVSLVVLLISSFYYIPLIYDKLFFNTFGAKSPNPGLIGVINEMFSFVPKEYSFRSDYNYGPFIISGAGIAMLYYFFNYWRTRKKKKEVDNFFFSISIVSMVALFLLSYVSLFRDSFPNERVGFYLQVFFYINIAIVLSNKKIYYFLFFILLVLGFILTTTKLEYILKIIPLLSLLIFDRKLFKFKLKFSDFISLILLIVLIIPIMLLFNETNVLPRIWCYHFFPTDFIGPQDVYISDLEGGFGFHVTYGAKMAFAPGSMKGVYSMLSNLSTPYYYRRLGVTKIFLFRKSEELTKEFGEPLMFLISRRGITGYIYVYILNDSYSFDSIDIVNPGHIIVDTNGGKELPISYHPFWKSDDAKLYNDNGFITLDTDKERINLVFDTKLFWISDLITIMSLLSFALLRERFYLFVGAK